MNLLDRYIFKSVLFSCAAAVAVLGFVLMVGNVVRDLLPLLLNGQLGFGTFLRLTLLLVPFVLTYALPMGMLAGVLLTLGRLSADNEVTTMRTAGLSLPRIARPVLILGAIGAASGLYINFESMPWGRVEFHREVAVAERANPLNFIVPKTFIRDFPGIVVYIGEKQGSQLKDFWLWQLDPQQRVIRFYRAESGRLDYDEPHDQFFLTLHDAQVQQPLDPKAPEDFTEAPYVATFVRSAPIPIDLRGILGQVAGRITPPRWMTYRQLRAEQVRLALGPVPPGGAKQHAQDAMRVAYTIQDKFNTALAVFTFALVGVPLGIRVSRRETSANLGVAVALALGYYFLAAMVSWLDQHPEDRPDLLIWAPNLIFLGLGLWLFQRLDRTA